MCSLLDTCHHLTESNSLDLNQVLSLTMLELKYFPLLIIELHDINKKKEKVLTFFYIICGNYQKFDWTTIAIRWTKLVVGWYILYTNCDLSENSQIASFYKLCGNLRLFGYSSLAKSNFSLYLSGKILKFFYGTREPYKIFRKI